LPSIALLENKIDTIDPKTSLAFVETFSSAELTVATGGSKFLKNSFVLKT